MIPEQFLKIFETNPDIERIIGAVLIIAFMIFIAILFKGWPEDLFTLGNSNEEEDDDDELEETRYSVKWKQTRINLGDHGFPESVEGTFTIKKEEED